MLSRFIFGAALLLPVGAFAAESRSFDLLKRDLGEQLITANEGAEIRYCPGDTCEVYRSEGDRSLLATYAYLHLYHQSELKELATAKAGHKAFRDTAREEPEIRRSVEERCKGKEKTDECILDALKTELALEQCTARYYDKGEYCETCGKKTKCRNLMVKTKAVRGTGGSGSYSSGGRRCGR